MEVALISILTVIASSVGTLTGFGTSTIMVPVLVLFFPLPETLLLVGIIHWFGDVWKMILFRTGFKWKLILTFGIPGIVASYLGATLTFVAPENILSRILGIFLLFYVIVLFAKSSFKIPHTFPMAATGGTLSGFFAGIFGVGGAVRGMFLSAFDLPKSVYLFTTGAIAFIIDSTRLTTYLTKGTELPVNLLWGLIIFVPLSFVGAKIGKRVVDRIPQQKFRFVVAGFLFIIGLKLLIFSG